MYTKMIADGYIVAIGTGIAGEEISESEYNTVMQKIQNKQTAPNGYAYKLRADNLEWELVELPTVDPVEEAGPEDYESALAEMGVDFSD